MCNVMLLKPYASLFMPIVTVFMYLFRQDPVTGQDEPFYPFKRRVFKMSGSFSLLLFMVNYF